MSTAGNVAPEHRTFLCKLYPPRPSFMTDMTADERDIMNAHVAYWRAKLAEGQVVAFGPVADPSGVWGLGIVKAKDEAELAAFRAGDPTIASGRGFRYEVIPMVSVVY